ncbi:MAG: hypothetical protein V4773_08775 [Verrucomicrobiota bacterium]
MKATLHLGKLVHGALFKDDVLNMAQAMRAPSPVSSAAAERDATEPLPSAVSVRPADPVVAEADLAAFRSRLLATTVRHFDRLLKADGTVSRLKGKSGDGMTALAFQLGYELTGNEKYRAAAWMLADRIVADMRATKHGVLYIKEKETTDGEAIDGGGPPAFGWYTSAAAYILQRRGGREADLRYLAAVAERFPWNEQGWWANTIDIESGEPKTPLTKPGAINKNAGMALAAGVLAHCVRGIDDELATRLQAKVERCVYGQIVPKQQADGFWHYGLKDTDPKGKDILGYFMLTADALTRLRHFAPEVRRPALDAALEKAFGFAREQIAPMTDPNTGEASGRRTAGTPKHFALGKDPKRGFTLGMLLIAGGYQAEGMKILDHWMKNFPTGDAGQDGARAADCFVHILLFLAQPGSRPDEARK